jgi:isoquinoline 1-oxidoreductase beta subunit
MTELTRRQFLNLSAISSFGLLIGISRTESADTDSDSVLQRLIRINDTGRITLYAQNPELGQGVKTSLPMIIAEELDVDWSDIVVEQANWDSLADNQFSGGSASIRLNFDAMRKAGATARQMLLQAAANRWRVPISELHTQHGEVNHAPSNMRARYGDLARAAAALPVPDSPPLKRTSEFKLIGKPIKDIDLPQIITGSLKYSQDIKLPNIVYVAVRRSPYSDGHPVWFDHESASEVDGVIGFESLRNDHYGGRIVLPNSPNFVSGVAVVAETTWAALTGARLLKVKWDEPHPLADSDELIERFEKALNSSAITVRKDGDVNEVAGASTDLVDVTYHVPFLAHAPMEPMNCTVDASGDQIEVWAATQNPALLANTLAKVLDVDATSIIIHVLRSGGAFGRRFYADYAVDTALLSRKLGRPVKIVWTREDDLRHDYFRPASVHRVKAAVDDTGQIVSWHQKMVSHARKPFLEREGTPAEIRANEFPAGFVPNLLYEYSHVPARIPVGQWRAIEYSSNVFVTASVIDELAHLAGEDPLNYLQRLIGDEPFVQITESSQLDVSRLIRVIKRAASEADWGAPLPHGHGRGIAASFNQGAWVAEVAEVSVLENVLLVRRIVAAVDCGLIINPAGAEAQVQGGIIEGVGAALNGEITVKNGVVQQSNFHDYRICTMRQAPIIDVHFIESNAEPRGLGEPPLPPVAPAICNAIFDAIGTRIRRLPLKNHFSV